MSRVWRALCDPAEVVQWDSGVLEALNAPPDYPQPGQHVRWRIRSGVFRLLHDRPVEVTPEKTLRSLLSLGPYEMDETYSLSQTPGGTRIDLRVMMKARVPVFGSLLLRLHGWPSTLAGFEGSLAGLKGFCEG